MKKALLILLALSIVGAAAFADVKFGAFATIGMRADYNMNVGGGTTNSDSLYAWEWFQGTPLIGLATASFTGADPNMGFDTRFIVIPGGVIPNFTNYGNVDYANAWMKLAEGMFKLNLGLFQASEDFETTEQAYGQNQWNSGNVVAFTAYAYPIEGLTVGYQLPLATASGTSIADNLYNSKIGLRYAMKDVFSVTGGYMMAKTEKTSNAYFGVDIKAIPNLGLWFEGLMVNIGSTLPVTATSNVGGETDLYLEANYPVMTGLKVGLAGQYNIIGNSSNQPNAWVVEPYVVYTVMENFNLMGAFDIGSASGLGNNNVWGWYGLQYGGPGINSSTNADGLAWDVFVRASLMSPLGELRIQAKYGVVDTKVPSGSNSPSYFSVFAGVKWGF